MATNMIAAIMKDSEMPADSCHSIADGVVSWSGGTIAAVVIEDPNSICAIYRYQGGQLDLPFHGVPCKFQGPPTLVSDRKTVLPDVVFAVEVFVPNLGAMVNHKVAFYYDAEKILIARVNRSRVGTSLEILRWLLILGMVSV